MRAAVLSFALLLAAAPAAAQPEPAPGVDVLQQLPEDVRAKLTGEQLADIVDGAQRMRGRELENILIPIVFFATIIGVVFLVMWARMRRDGRLHETLRAMIDKGVDIPPALLVPQQAKPDDRRRGVLLVTTGVGLCVFLQIVAPSGTQAWAVGLVPAFLGMGYLLAAFLDRGRRAPTSPPATANEA